MAGGSRSTKRDPLDPYLRIPDALPDHLREIWEDMGDSVGPQIGEAGMEALCIQVYRMRDAQRRITEEGEVVADARGNPVPHPALAIEQKAGAEVRKWIGKFPPPRKSTRGRAWGA